jgi:hypothetical protein
MATTGRVPVRVVVVAYIDSISELYDFVLYGTAAALVFGLLFFPKTIR